MDIFKVIKNNRKLLENKGFTYSWFPCEDSFHKDDFWFTIHTYGQKYENYEVSFYKKLYTPDEVSFNFFWVKFNDSEKNKVLWEISIEHDRCKSLQMFLDFIINNIEWLQNLTKKDIAELNYRNHLTSFQIYMLKHIKIVLCTAEEELENKKSIWDKDEIVSVINEMQELLKNMADGQIYFKYGKKERMFESTYHMTDSFKPLFNTQLGKAITKLQEMYYKA